MLIRLLITFFFSKGIKNRLNDALLKNKNVKNFAALSLICRPNWNKEKFFKGDQKSLKKYEEGMENALDRFLAFARNMGVEFFERPRGELKNLKWLNSLQGKETATLIFGGDESSKLGEIEIKSWKNIL